MRLLEPALVKTAMAALHGARSGWATMAEQFNFHTEGEDQDCVNAILALIEKGATE